MILRISISTVILIFFLLLNGLLQLLQVLLPVKEELVQQLLFRNQKHLLLIQVVIYLYQSLVIKGMGIKLIAKEYGFDIRTICLVI
jgi:hypothetical protein